MDLPSTSPTSRQPRSGHRRASRWLSLLPAGLLLACAGVSHAGEATVQFADPAKFTDVRDAQRRNIDVQQPLTETLQSLAKRWLPADRSLDITITDVDLAGEVEPIGPRMDMVRVMRQVTWPRIKLSYTLRDASGAALRSAELNLTDMDYLNNHMLATSTDPMRFEKQMLSDWFRKEFAADSGK